MTIYMGLAGHRRDQPDQGRRSQVGQDGIIRPRSQGLHSTRHNIDLRSHFVPADILHRFMAGESIDVQPHRHPQSQQHGRHGQHTGAGSNVQDTDPTGRWGCRSFRDPVDGPQSEHCRRVISPSECGAALNRQRMNRKRILRTSCRRGQDESIRYLYGAATEKLDMGGVVVVGIMQQALGHISRIVLLRRFLPREGNWAVRAATRSMGVMRR